MRGFVWARYVDDLGRAWALRVDGDYALDGDRGWSTADVGSLVPFPRAWRARRVVGLDPLGNERQAIAATTEAAIWDGTASQFIFETDDLQLLPATIIARLQERIRPTPPAG